MKTVTNQNAKGYVYILGNNLFPHLLKIGRTSRTTEIRCKELSHSTAIPEPFFIIDSFFSYNSYLLEYLTHAYLMCENKRYNLLKEFFITNKNEASAIIRALNAYIQNNTTMNSQSPVGFTPWDILPEEDYVINENNWVDPFLYCAKFNFSSECPIGLNPVTWQNLINQLRLKKQL